MKAKEKDWRDWVCPVYVILMGIVIIMLGIICLVEVTAISDQFSGR
jgi:hypothetical protein